MAHSLSNGVLGMLSCVAVLLLVDIHVVGGRPTSYYTPAPPTWPTHGNTRDDIVTIPPSSTPPRPLTTIRRTRPVTYADFFTTCPPPAMPECMPGYRFAVDYNGPCPVYYCKYIPTPQPPPSTTSTTTCAPVATASCGPGYRSVRHDNGPCPEYYTCVVISTPSTSTTPSSPSTSCGPVTTASCAPGYRSVGHDNGPCPEYYTCVAIPTSRPPSPPPSPSPSPLPTTTTWPCPQIAAPTCLPGYSVKIRYEGSCKVPYCAPPETTPSTTTTTDGCPAVTPPESCGPGRGLFLRSDDGCPVWQCVTTPAMTTRTTSVYCSYPVVTCGPNTRFRVRYESLCPVYYCEPISTTSTLITSPSPETTPITTDANPVSQCPPVIPVKCPRNFKTWKIVLNGCAVQRCIHNKIVIQMKQLRRQQRKGEKEERERNRT